MFSDDAVRALTESEMEAVVGGHGPSVSGDPTGED